MSKICDIIIVSLGILFIILISVMIYKVAKDIDNCNPIVITTERDDNYE